MKVRHVVATAAAPTLLLLWSLAPAAPTPPAPAEGFADIRAVVSRRCVPCHSPTNKSGGLDLSRFRSEADLRANPKPWSGVLEQVEAGQMPPAGAPALTPKERRLLTTRVRELLDREARARADDPGQVLLRRLSNTEYDNTIRDLTAVDLQPTREFPHDGAGGEGFTNAGEALTEISPTLFTKYLAAAREVADHAVFTPSGMRFSPSKTRRDWSDEGVARLRSFYAPFSNPEGVVELLPYVKALIQLAHTKDSVEAVAQVHRVNARYLAALRTGLTDLHASEPLRGLGERIAQAAPEDAVAITAELLRWRDALWRVVNVGNYIQTVDGQLVLSLTRQQPVAPSVVASGSLSWEPKPTPSQHEAVWYLRSTEAEAGGGVVWGNPRFEAPGKAPLLLRDYAQFGPRYETDPRSLFTKTAAYLAGVQKVGEGAPLASVAARDGLDPALLQSWITQVGAAPGDPTRLGRPVVAVALSALSQQIARNPNQPAINGWHKPGAELPALLSNASDTELRIPGTAAPHHVVVHPSPQEFVAVVWTSPVSGEIAVTPRIAHAHLSCGNGIAWWLEHRRGQRATRLSEDRLPLGGKSAPEALRFQVEPGDQLVLAVDAKDGDHSCDLTDLDLTIATTDGKRWELARSLSGTILDPTTHGPWRFVAGPSQPVGTGAEPLIPVRSVLGQWQAAVRAKRSEEAAKRAAEAQTLLAGPRPASGPDAVLWDNLVRVDSPLLETVEVARLGTRLPSGRYGTLGGRFRGDDLITPSNATVQVRVPSVLLRGYRFVVDARLPEPVGERAVRFTVSETPSGGGPGLLVGKEGTRGVAQLRKGFDAFRQLFPRFVSFPGVIPNDEVVSLKMFHRDDEPLVRLFLDDKQRAELENLWAEHRFVSRQAVAENAYLPQFIGFVTQDQSKAMVTFFENQRPIFARRVAEFERSAATAAPRQVDAVVAFADRAWRRPCTPTEQAQLRGLYQQLRQQGAEHEDALRRVLARILSAPAFLLRIESAPTGTKPAAVSDWELATRLSYFVWATLPDEALRKEAARGTLHEPAVLTKHLRRMIADPKARALAEEFGAQWIHVRDFSRLNEKNERLFPQFDSTLRAAIYEETVRFFQDLFQADRPVSWLLDADATFVNDTLARHYGIPGIEGTAWRRVTGVRRYGRGGLLGLASVQAKESAASRTSPVLRGNWISETLLGEKLPPPPANVPKLPEEEGTENLTVRQLTQRHVKNPACWSCHQRIDPLGFALERYDAIGRLRTKESGGLPIDASTTLRDGSSFTGIEGLRDWLLTKKKPTVVRVFSKRLLGYALGRSTTLSDTALLERMEAAMQARGGRVSGALEAIVLSPQFRQVRGSGEKK